MAEAVNQSEGRWKNQKEDGKRGCDQARCGDKRDGGGCQDVRDGETEVIRSNLSTKSTRLALLKLVQVMENLISDFKPDIVQNV